MTYTFARALYLLALPLFACGGGGGGGSTPEVLLQFSDESSHSDEGDDEVVVSIELQLTAATLADELVFLVRDSSSGAAASGSDYEAFATRSFTLPAGTPDGATRTVRLSALQDTLIEGAEDVVLELSCDSAAVGGSGTHTITLQDDDLAEVHFLEATSASTTEDGPDLTAQVELVYDSSLTLANEIALEVTTTNGSDARNTLDFLLSSPLVFSSGSASGTQATLTINLIDDEVPEVDEEAILRFVAHSALEVEGSGTHRFWISDDDISPDPFLATLTDASGAWLPVENGDELDFGSADISAGASNSLHFQLINFGIVPLSVGNLVISGANEREFSVELESYTMGRGPREDWLDLPFPYEPEHTPSAFGRRLLLNASILEVLQLQTKARLHGLQLDEKHDVALELERLPSPLRQDTILAVDGVPNAGLLETLRSEISFWRGRVLGHPQSRVFLAFSQHGSRGWVELDRSPNRRYELASLGAYGDKGEDAGICILGAREQALDPSLVEELCVQALPTPAASGPRPRDDGKTQATFPEVSLALESDYQLFQVFGTSLRTTTYITALAAAVSQQFLADAQVILSIGYLGIWTNAGDPWTTPDGPGTTLEMLEEFRAAWAPALGGSWPVEADMAHFLSGANLGGGIAYLDALCNVNYCFGVSAGIEGVIDWDNFDGSSAGTTWDFVVFAHELGHNFGSRHTHDYCPPLDRCQGSCSGGAICSEGTIMSYCHLCGGMANIELAFHPWNANIMRAAVQNACFSEASLELNEELQFLLTFRPTGSAGEHSANLALTHDGRNTDSPFEASLIGTAQD